MNHLNPASSCRCIHHKVVPFLIIILGLELLLQTLGVLPPSMIGYVLPVILILIGLVKLKSGSCKCYEKSGT